MVNSSIYDCNMKISPAPPVPHIMFAAGELDDRQRDCVKKLSVLLSQFSGQVNDKSMHIFGLLRRFIHLNSGTRCAIWRMSAWHCSTDS